MTRLAGAYLDAAASAATLLADPAVAAAWSGPSALSEFRVSGLAGHLALQVVNVPVVLAASVAELSGGPDVAPITLEEHYARVLWRGADVDTEVNTTIRAGGESRAEQGPASLAEEARQAVDALRKTLPAEDGQRAVLAPAGWALTLDDYLTTRLMEIAVHSDDLAVSVGLPTPQLPEASLRPVFDLLVMLARQRHGDTAVLRALSRAERAPERINAI